MRFHVYIDESGEAGIAKVRNANNGGASPYFVLGAVVCDKNNLAEARQAIVAFKRNIGKTSWKHATELSHKDKVYLARELGKLPVRYFSVISKKTTLGKYKSCIEADSQKFYNKCVQYLLEKICAYLISAGAKEGELKVILERMNHDYGMMISFLSKVKKNPIEPQSNALKILNPFAITNLPKGKDEMLDIADFIAHAIYQCSNKTPKNYFIPEPRYFTEISSRFAGNKKGKILGTGIKCIHNIAQLELDTDIQELFEHAACKPPKKK